MARGRPSAPCAKIPRIRRTSRLATPRRLLIALLTLIALVLGQSAATLHALKHYGSGDDAAGAPAEHVQLCLECVSFAPLASPHGSPALVLFVAALGLWMFLRWRERPPVAARPHRAFRSRAPPR
jgi:hypothetical protein